MTRLAAPPSLPGKKVPKRQAQSAESKRACLLFGVSSSHGNWAAGMRFLGGKTLRRTQSMVDATRHRPTSCSEMGQHGGTILVVEDERFVRDVTCEILESEGYRVLQARNGAEALSVFQSYRKIVKLLLADLMLPGKNGEDLATEMRETSPSLKVLLVSGYPQSMVAKQRSSEPDTFYLPKPFSAVSLTRAVSQALQQGSREDSNCVCGTGQL